MLCMAATQPRHVVSNEAAENDAFVEFCVALQSALCFARREYVDL